MKKFLRSAELEDLAKYHLTKAGLLETDDPDALHKFYKFWSGFKSEAKWLWEDSPTMRRWRMITGALIGSAAYLIIMAVIHLIG